MNTKLFALLLVVLIFPGLAFAERPSITNLNQEVVKLAAIVNQLVSDLESTRAELAATQKELALVKLNSVLGLDGRLALTQDANGNDTAVFNGVNVQIVNGVGNSNAMNGRGNLLIGYNTDSSGFASRIGSHNIVLGDEQSYPDTQALVTESIVSDRNLSLLVANDMDTTVGGNRQSSVGGSQQTSIGANQTEAVGGSKSTSVGSNKTEQVGGSASVQVGNNASIDIGSNLSLAVGEDANVLVGNKLSVDAGDEIAMKTGAASATMKKNGTIQVGGTNISIEGSGTVQVKASGDLVLKGAKILEN